jgi:hypothetical protein
MLLSHPFVRNFLVSVRTGFLPSLRTIDFREPERERGKKGSQQCTRAALQHATDVAFETMMSVEVRREPRQQLYRRSSLRLVRRSCKRRPKRDFKPLNVV